MPKVSEVCSHVRSKNAGPFWITLDFWFPDRVAFDHYSVSPALQPVAIGALYGVDPAQVKFFSVPNLNVVKISYPRACPQGGVFERDMHGGQQFLPVLDLEL